MPVHIGIAGIQGRMGREIRSVAASDPQFAVMGGLGRQPREHGSDFVFDTEELLPQIDVLVDFTSPDGAVRHAAACAAAGVPMVTGTTGLDAAQMRSLRGDAERIALFQAANMSPGVNAALAVLPALVRALADYDVEIVETHHRHKVDAPSGTALALARAVTGAAIGASLEERARYGREGVAPRAPGEIGIHAVRGGGNPGEHTVILAGDGEEIRLSVRAFSRAAYAQGALRAARLLVGQPPGWYEPSTLPGFL